MPSLTPSEIKEIISRFPDNMVKFDNFLETGTYHGQTILGVENLFTRLHTIELGEDLYNEVISKYNGDKISFYLGDTTKVLKGILHTMDNTVFFLDSHWSCGDTVKGEKDVPLLDELELIFKKFKKNAILIINDYRLFNGKDEFVDWKDISLTSVMKRLHGRILSQYFMASELSPKDRLIINIKSL